MQPPRHPVVQLGCGTLAPIGTDSPPHAATTDSLAVSSMWTEYAWKQGKRVLPYNSIQYQVLPMSQDYAGTYTSFPLLCKGVEFCFRPLTGVRQAAIGKLGPHWLRNGCKEIAGKLLCTHPF